MISWMGSSSLFLFFAHSSDDVRASCMSSQVSEARSECVSSFDDYGTRILKVDSQKPRTVGVQSAAAWPSGARCLCHANFFPPNQLVLRNTTLEFRSWYLLACFFIRCCLPACCIDSEGFKGSLAKPEFSAQRLSAGFWAYGVDMPRQEDRRGANAPASR